MKTVFVKSMLVALCMVPGTLITSVCSGSQAWMCNAHCPNGNIVAVAEDIIAATNTILRDIDAGEISAQDNVTRLIPLERAVEALSNLVADLDCEDANAMAALSVEMSSVLRRLDRTHLSIHANGGLRNGTAGVEAFTRDLRESAISVRALARFLKRLA